MIVIVNDGKLGSSILVFYQQPCRAVVKMTQLTWEKCFDTPFCPNFRWACGDRQALIHVQGRQRAPLDTLRVPTLFILTSPFRKVRL